MSAEVLKLATGLAQKYDDALFDLAKEVAKDPDRAESKIDDIYDYVMSALHLGGQLCPLIAGVPAPNFVTDSPANRQAVLTLIESLEVGGWTAESAATIAFKLSDRIQSYASYLVGHQIGEPPDADDGLEEAL